MGPTLICPVFGRSAGERRHNMPGISVASGPRFALLHTTGTRSWKVAGIDALVPSLRPHVLSWRPFTRSEGTSGARVGEYLGFQLRQFNHPAQCSALPVCSRVS